MQDLFIIFLSAVPVGELQVSLPLAVEAYHFSIPRALFDVYLGNALPVLPLLFGLTAFTKWCDRHIQWVHRLLTRVFQRTESRFKDSHQRYGAIALFLFVAVPFPLSGVWSGSVAAVLFGIRPKIAAPAIIGGMMCSGLIVLAITKGVFVGLRLF